MSILSKMKSPEFVLGTLDSAPAGSPTPFVPRVRTCIFRGFWTEIPENDRNDAPRNPNVYGSDCPTFSTDVRMEKVAQIFRYQCRTCRESKIKFKEAGVVAL